ncbi:MSHA biogenesis protein MshQ [Alteromonadaceae bacterium 2753L.S.0a.02]|nr:MSHA biogenesis protein MshQ [Alteromonadaceae bacterium 2753L.S.0a.02]
MSVSRVKNIIQRLLQTIGILSITTSFASAQDCSEIFPGAAQNSNPSGDVIIQWNSQLLNTPGNTVVTRTFTDNAGPNRSCGSVSCTSINNTVPSSVKNSYNNFDGNISLGSNQTRTRFPGQYGSLTLGYNSTLNLTPGVYTFSSNFNMGSDSRIVVSSPGSVTIFVQGDITLNNAAQINSANSNRYVFLYSHGSTVFGSSATVNAVVYSRFNFTMQNGAAVVGAVTSRFNLTLNSASTITYDSSSVTNTNYDDFCNQYVSPNLVAEWRLDELTWSGAADEVLDNSGNNLHGRARDPYGATVELPQTSLTLPAIVGSPGTCRYGDFKGSADGFVQIDDPGTGSILDLSEYSVTSWIYARRWATSGLMTIVSKDENFEYHLNNNGQVNWWWGGGSQELTTGVSVPINAWHHIAITYESGTQAIYIDGILEASHNDSNAVTLNNDPVLIGIDLDFQSRLFDGFIDEVRIYDGPLSQADVNTVMNETHPCIPENLLDHFIIDVGAGSASTCIPTQITITAEDASDNTLLDYVGDIEITTSTGNGSWSATSNPLDAQGALTPGVADSGDASYEFEVSEADQGSIILNLGNSHAEALSITVEDAGAGVTITSGALTFSENAFVVNVTDSLGNDVVAGRDHNFQIQMIRNDPDTGSCGPATEYDVATVKMWLSRDSSDPGGAAPAALTASETETLPDTEPAAANLTLPFIDGIANFSLQTSDVGRYALQFKDDNSGFSDLAISGGSSTLVARPFGFDVQGTGNPGASLATGPVFTVAGQDFSATVRAVIWQAADDADDNGIADGHNDNDPTNNANLADNSEAVSFGSETPSEGVQLSETLQLPVAGNDPGLATSATPDGRQLRAFTSGIAATSTIYFSEVGVIELEARVLSGDYLNTGSTFSNRIQGRSGYVGRFVPNHFAVVPSAINAACGTAGFSYMEQAFSTNYVLDARNLANQLTQNYTADFARLDPAAGLGTINYAAIDTASSTQLTSRTNGTTVVPWLNGSALAIGTITLSRGATPDGPFNDYSLGVDLLDADNVTLRTADYDLDVDNDTLADHVNLGSHIQFFGRLRLADAFGPETANLPVVFVTEYWDGSTWLQNGSDSCSAINLNQISYSTTGTIDTVANRTVTIGASTTTGSYTDLSGGNVNFSSGDAGHYFSAPGTGNTGSFQVDVNLLNYPWLRFDWNNDADYSDIMLPSANYTFGSYRGHDRIIYWREVF